MNILLLGSDASLLNCFDKRRDFFLFADNLEQLKVIFQHSSVDILISYGFRHRVPKEFLNRVSLMSMNLHIGLLPFNKGSHPNVWSHLENTPSGVTLHEMVEHIDEGNVIIQSEVKIDDSHSFRTSYELLKEEMQSLFSDWWISSTKPYGEPNPASSSGTKHFQRHLAALDGVLLDGWDTKIARAKELYLDQLSDRGCSQLICIHNDESSIT